MAQINVLDQNTINQIAAGEVIERPSSVVKELVENAMDAGASAVTIEIREGGISMIRVTDNGSGIPSDQIPVAFLRHSTSKIRSVEDLVSISSLGFRGEALSSIAAVAQVELITKTPESLTGTRYLIEGGEEKKMEEVGAPGGTTFLVRNLFFNTPARRKFLKSAATEGNYITALVEHLALSHPDISFRLLVNNQTRLHTAGNHKLKDIIYTIYGRQITQALMPLKAVSEHIHIEGFIGKPEINRGNRTFENYFINGRYVKSAIITKALENAYQGYVMQHKYPFAVFHMTIDSSFLDVNVHPTKMELRFHNEEEVYRTVYEGVRQALMGKELLPTGTFTEESKDIKENVPAPRGAEIFEERRIEREQRKQESFVRPRTENSGSSSEKSGAVRERVVYEPSTIEKMQQNIRNSLLGNRQVTEQKEETLIPQCETKENTISQGENTDIEIAKSEIDENTVSQNEKIGNISSPQQMNLFDEKIVTAEARSEYRLIGQLFDTYWLIQYKDSFLIMDQHAAHEKVLYEKTMKTLRQKEMLSQQVQPPLILTLNSREQQTLQEYAESFEKFGFAIEPFGGKEYAVSAVPSNLFGIARQDLLIEMIDTLSDEGGHTKMTIIEEKIAMMSCKAAVKGNNHLSFAEAEALLDEMMTLDNPYMCPHGRPTMITMTKYELEKKFKRVIS